MDGRARRLILMGLVLLALGGGWAARGALVERARAGELAVAWLGLRTELPPRPSPSAPRIRRRARSGA